MAFLTRLEPGIISQQLQDTTNGAGAATINFQPPTGNWRVRAFASSGMGQAFAVELEKTNGTPLGVSSGNVFVVQDGGDGNPGPDVVLNGSGNYNAQVTGGANAQAFSLFIYYTPA